jgi:hypothetical protein
MEPVKAAIGRVLRAHAGQREREKAEATLVEVEVTGYDAQSRYGGGDETPFQGKRQAG